MPQHRIDTQYVLDRAAIQDLHGRYFRGLDRGEPDEVRRCFTDDVTAVYDGRSALRPGAQAPVRGIDALMDSLVTFKNQKTGIWKVTTHFMGNLSITLLEGDVAETETNAIAFLVLPGEPADQVAMRSLRYLDRLRRMEDGWRISERLHTLDWSCQVPTTFAVTMAQRQMARPDRAAPAGTPPDAVDHD
jgi:hypothetical protein